MGAKRDLEDNSVQQRVKAWFEWMDACEQFLLAGMQRDVGPGGDIRSAYRQWHEKQMEEFGSWLGSDSSLRGRPVCVV